MTTKYPGLPQLDYSPSKFTARLLERVPQLREPYRPTPWLFNAHLQVLWLLLGEVVAPPLTYDRHEILRMRDGGTTALDWIGEGRGADAPTLVVLPSITGDAQSMRNMVRDLLRLTPWRIVVCMRRGHGDLKLTAPRLNTMGCADDFREQLAHIRKRYPRSPLYGIGVSAGSALLVRYLGEEGRRSLIRAAVAYCPGYDIRVAWGRVPSPYNRIMVKRLQHYFLERHEAALRGLPSYAACAAATDLAAFHENLYGLAGCKDLEDYLARSNPMAVFDGIRVPVMVLNAADDPVCVEENALENLDAVRRIPNALLVRTEHGSHCAFFEGWNARSWANRLMASYLQCADAEPASGRRREAPAVRGRKAVARGVLGARRHDSRIRRRVG